MGKVTSRVKDASGSKPRPASKPPAKQAKPADPHGQTRARLKMLRARGEPIYRAEFAQWSYARGGRLEKRRDGRYFIHEEGSNGKLVATIIINPEVAGGEEAWRIAQLMACAPDLWRLLAKIAPMIENNDCNEELNEATEALTNAAGRRPFDWRVPNRDEPIYVKNMRDAGFVVAESIKTKEAQ